MEAELAQRDAEARAAGARTLADVAAELYPVTAPDLAAAAGASVTVSVRNGPMVRTGDAAKTDAVEIKEVKAGEAAKRGAVESGGANTGTAGDGLHESPEQLLEARVLRRLVTAAADYCTDDRGDVGSWVREAAMASLARILPLWAAHCRAAQTAAHSSSDSDSSSRLKPSGDDGAREGGDLHGSARIASARSGSNGRVTADTVRDSAASCRGEADAGSGGTTTEVACALLQQAAERLDRLRKVGVRFCH